MRWMLRIVVIPSRAASTESSRKVVLAWLLHRQPALIPVPGASSVAQLDEILAATELKLNAETLDRLDRAGRFAS